MRLAAPKILFAAAIGRLTEDNMNQTQETLAQDVADAYIAFWNETDAQKRRELFAQSWTNDAAYLDPLMNGEGQEPIVALVEGVHAQFPGHRFSRVGKVEQVGHCLRFSWHLAPEGQNALVGGTDFCIVSPDGRLQSVTGFLDFAPGLPASGLPA